ncbi:MAG: carboxy terminal-processing peptidase [Gammaproteobacteria bacterium]|nr:carboxy terminal-processing peptidase [Gammaproteobacteria bacterium]
MTNQQNEFTSPMFKLTRGFIELLKVTNLKMWTFFAVSSSLASLTVAQDGPASEALPVLDVEALYSTLSSEPVHGETAANLLKELKDKHYSGITFDDNFSSVIFDKYLDNLDGSKLYLLKSDIDEIAVYRYRLDDSLKAGSVEPGFEIYNIYYKRLLERLIYAVNRVENHIDDMDFSVEEYIVIDREEEPFANSISEADEIWRKRVKNSVLSLRIAGDSNDEIKEKLSKRYRNQLAQIMKTNSRDIFQAYLATVASSVDPHTSYFSPRDSENFNMGLSLSLQGIGAQLTSEDEYTKVVELIKGGPAERGEELQAGDRIISIGQDDDGELVDVVGMRLDDVVSKIRGEKGTTVRLNVIPVNATGEESAKTISIVRDTVKLEDQSAKKEVLELSYEGSDYRIGVIALPTFYFDFEAAARGEKDYKSSTRDVKILLEELKEEGVDAVVVDLRNDGGGSLQEANQLVGLFIESGPTVQIKYSGSRNGFTRSYGDNDPEVTYDGPLAVLVNRTSASASEIFAGAIQDYQRGLVLGGQTFGKGTVQEIIGMEYGQVKLTRSKFYRISGESTQHRGVIPDIAFPDFYDAYDDIGESSLDGALPWDTVRPVEYRRYNPIDEILPTLKFKHEARASSSPDFKYLQDQITRTKRSREREKISLNEVFVKAERESLRREEFDADNVRRQAKGLTLREWKDDNDRNTEDEVASNAVSETDDVEPAVDTEQSEEDEDDPLLIESGKILVDFISLNRDAQNIGTQASIAQ